MPNKQRYCGQLQNHVRIANFSGENRKTTIPSIFVKSIPPNTENSMQYGYDENDNNNMSNETKCETNYSMNNKWNDVNTHNYMQLTKYNKYTNDDVYTDACVVHIIR